MRLLCLLIASLLLLGATPREIVGIKGTEYRIFMPVQKEVKPFERLKEALGQRESRNNYHIVNQIGCLGKYQFTKRTLKGLGYTNQQIKDFIYCYKVKKNSDNTLVYQYSVDMQEEAMDKLLQRNLEWLRYAKLLKYEGKTVGGIKITIEGMLAACHLLGGEALKDYLRSNGDMRQYHKILKSGRSIYIRKFDGNGTSIKEYLTLIK